MRGAASEARPGRAAMPSRGVGAAAPSTLARLARRRLDVLAGFGEGSDGTPCFPFGLRNGVGDRRLLQPLRPERR